MVWVVFVERVGKGSLFFGWGQWWGVFGGWGGGVMIYEEKTKLGTNKN